MRTIAAAVLLFAALATESTAQIANDSCATATSVTSLPFTASVDVTDAADDPAPPDSVCGASSQNAWFAVHSSAATTILVETPDTATSTSVNVYRGACGSLVDVGCDGQSDGGTKVLVPLGPGETLYVAVSGSPGAFPVSITTARIDATPPSLSAAVLSGDPSPLGGAFSGFGPAVMVTPDVVAFTGTTEGVFADLGSGVAAVAMSGDPAPGGGTFSAMGPPAIDGAGNVYFVANVDGGPASAGIFRRSGATTTALLRTGDPGPTGAPFARISRWIGVNDAGDLVFVAAGTSSRSDALYVMTGGVVSGPLVSEFDSTPCGTVSRLGTSRSLAINSAGEVAVFMQTFPPSRRGIMRIVGGWVEAAVCEDDPAPGGGAYRTLSPSFALGDSPTSTIVFRASTTSASARIFRHDLLAGASVAVAPGAVASGGEIISSLPNAAVTVDASDTVGFVGRIGTHNAAIVQPAGPVPPTVVTQFGSPCPAGGTVRVVDTDLAGDELGTLVVDARCADSAGVFAVSAGSHLAAVATDGTTTPIGPGLRFGDASRRAARTAMRGSRTAVYQRSCKNGACGSIEAVAAQNDPVPGLAGERIWDIDEDTFIGRRKQAVFTAGTIGGRELVLAARHRTVRTVAIGDTVLPGTTFTPTRLRDGGVSTDGRSIAFVATGTDTADGLEHTAVVLARHGRFEQMAREDDPVVVGTEATEYLSFTATVVKGGTVTVYASTGIADCWMELRGTSARPLVCDGFPMPEGSIEGPVALRIDVGALSSRGLVVPVRGDSIFDECLLSARRGDVRSVACSGDALPGGGAADAFSSTLRIAAAGSRIVTAVDGTVRSGLFAFGKNRLALVAGDGAAGPFGSGGTWDLSTARPSIAGAVVAFDATIIGGTHSRLIALARLAR